MYDGGMSLWTFVDLSRFLKHTLALFLRNLTPSEAYFDFSIMFFVKMLYCLWLLTWIGDIAIFNIHILRWNTNSRIAALLMVNESIKSDNLFLFENIKFLRSVKILLISYPECGNVYIDVIRFRMKIDKLYSAHRSMCDIYRTRRI